MSELKIEKLLHSLSSAERQEFGNVINSGKRERLKKLWNLLESGVKKGELPKKADLFAGLFERSYSKKEDYLLRNEFRLLREELFTFFLRQYIDKGFRKGSQEAGIELLKALLDRELYAEFEFQIRAQLKKAQNLLDHHAVFELTQLHFYYVLQHKELRPEELEKLRKTLELNLESAKLHYRTRVAVNQQCQSVLPALTDLGEAGKNWITIGADENLAPFTDPVVEYFEAMARGNQSGGAEKVKWGQKAVSAAFRIEEGHPEKKLDALAALAIAFFLDRKYEAALEQFQKLFDLALSLKRKPRIEVLYNYCSTLLKLSHFEKVISLIEARLEEIEANPRVRYAFGILHCFSYIFLKNPKKAADLVPEQLRTRAPNFYQYFRFILCILPFLRGDLEDGLRESSNFLNYFNRQKAESPLLVEKEMASIFRKFYLAFLNAAGREELAEKVQEIAGNLSEFVGHNPGYRDYLYVRWLEMEVEKVTAKN